jgi:branched-chain amino acid transport system substrate-binding protein
MRPVFASTATWLLLSFGLALPVAAQTPAAVPATAPSSAGATLLTNPSLPPLRIGLIFPLTGGSADMGMSAKVGAEVAVNEINQIGGYLGRRLELVVRDDEANPDVGLKHAQDLVLNEKVYFTVGFCNSGVAMKALDVFQSNQHILMVPCATGTAVTGKFPPAQSFIFRTAPRDKLQTQFLVDEIVKRKLSKVALLVDSSGYGDAGLKDLEAALAAANLKPQAVIRFKNGVRDLDAELKELKASGADALIGWTVGPESGVIAASKAAVGWNVPLLGPWGLSHASAFKTSGGKVEGGLMVQTVLPNTYLERNSSFLRAYVKLSKEQPIGSMMSAAQTYDAVHLLLRAVFDSKGNLKGPAIKNALENPTSVYRGVVTTYDHVYSSNDHDAISANMLWLGTWRNQERSYYYREDEKRATVIRRKE